MIKWYFEVIFEHEFPLYTESSDFEDYSMTYRNALPLPLWDLSSWPQPVLNSSASSSWQLNGKEVDIPVWALW